MDAVVTLLRSYWPGLDADALRPAYRLDVGHLPMADVCGAIRAIAATGKDFPPHAGQVLKYLTDRRLTPQEATFQRNRRRRAGTPECARCLDAGTWVDDDGAHPCQCLTGPPVVAPVLEDAPVDQDQALDALAAARAALAKAG